MDKITDELIAKVFNVPLDQLRGIVRPSWLKNPIKAYRYMIEDEQRKAALWVEEHHKGK